MQLFNFGAVKRFILLGGGGAFSLYAAKKILNAEYDLFLYSSKRLLENLIDGKRFSEWLDESNISYTSSDDINQDPQIFNKIDVSTVALSLGAPWIFRQVFIDRFAGRLLNMHGTRLPQYRGGGGYSWQILRRSNLGCCLIHQVDAGIDTGPIVFTKEFLFPPRCRSPLNYTEHHLQENKLFFDEFLTRLRAGENFLLAPQQEYFSSYWPRLNTDRHAYIDWSWDLCDIESFINAFDDPYQGASTFLNGVRVHLKECSVDFNDGAFHPFQTGIVYRANKRALFIAAGKGTLIVSRIQDGKGNHLLDSIRIGDRFMTPTRCLEDARQFHAVYTPQGLKED